MATTQNATPITLTVTDKAAAEVRKFMAEEHVTPETAGLRVGVLPGGCSGFRYSLSIENKPAADDIDRKSTRLNSSHSQISYAVFCLKKKKQRAQLLGRCDKH